MSRCRFDFPRPEREIACVNDVTDSLKSCSKIYYIMRGENEVRVDDYDPFFLMLWHASMDFQYISETSLALTEYVSGYVTKQRKVMYRIHGMT